MSILIEKGYSLSEIANVLGKAKSTIWYELQKSRKGRKYDSDYAHHLTYVRRKYSRAVGRTIALNQELEEFVRKNLFDDQSPEAISGRLRKIKNIRYISASAIRRYIKSPYGRRIEDYRLKIFRRRRKYCGKKTALKNKVMISKRPWFINKRKGLGHFEGDFIASGKSGKGMLLTLTDRKTRKSLIEKILPVSVRNVELALVRMRNRYLEMQTITFDNDVLLLEHKRLEKKLGIKIYFCHPRSPWEKPSVENLNRFIRRYIPKSSDISKYSRHLIKKLEAKANRRFMECLGYLTPEEVYEREKKQKTRRDAYFERKSDRSN